MIIPKTYIYCFRGNTDDAFVGSILPDRYVSRSRTSMRGGLVHYVHDYVNTCVLGGGSYRERDDLKAMPYRFKILM